MSDDIPTYDPLKAPKADWWLDLDEAERNILIADDHRRARATLPNVTAHAIFHAIGSVLAKRMHHVMTGGRMSQEPNEA